jgi:three-Cys-motif partner protein
MSPHQFGGDWTEEKLRSLQKYLSAYTTIFKGNERAAFLKTIFVDAFAGTGSRKTPRTNDDSSVALLEDVYGDEEALEFQKGSALIALEAEPRFDHYLFIEKNQRRVKELEQITSRFPEKAADISIVCGDANIELLRWVQQTNWRFHRAVVFLDPYGMSVEWNTVKALGETEAVDLWILFPLGQAVNRMLTKDRLPDALWSERLTRFFGTDDWQAAFYRPRQQMGMFDGDEALEKNASFEKIGDYFLKRLATTFVKVADNPLYLRNSKSVPLYMFCFASANPRGAPTAVKIAKDILKREAKP